MLNKPWAHFNSISRGTSGLLEKFWVLVTAVPRALPGSHASLELFWQLFHRCLPPPLPHPPPDMSWGCCGSSSRVASKFLDMLWALVVDAPIPENSVLLDYTSKHYCTACNKYNGSYMSRLYLAKGSSYSTLHLTPQSSFCIMTKIFFFL